MSSEELSKLEILTSSVKVNEENLNSEIEHEIPIFLQNDCSKVKPYGQ